MYIKVILKNLFDNWKKYLLLLVSVCMSSALFVLSFISTRMINNMAEENITTLYGSADIVLTGNGKNGSVFLDDNMEIVQIKDKLPIFCTYSTYQDNNATVYGLDLVKSGLFVKTDIVDGKSLKQLEKNEAVISYDSSKKYELNVGDHFQLENDGKILKFRVGAIAKEKGILGQENSDFFVICSKEYIEEFYGMDHVSNMVYAKLNDNNDSKVLISQIKKDHEELDISEITVEELLSGVTSNISRPLYIMLLMIVIMSIFIIYSAEKLIVMEIMPFVGTLLSVGATKRKVNFLLLSEAAVIGAIGGGIGSIIGAVSSYFIMDQANEYKQLGIQTQLPFVPEVYLGAVVFAVGLTLISAIIPILQTNRISTKNIVLNILDKENNNGGKTGIVTGFSLLAATIALTFYNRGLNNAYLAIWNLTVVIICLLLLVGPLAIMLMKPLLSFVQPYNLPCWMAANTLRGSNSLMNNIKLASICILTLNIVSIVSVSVIGGISNVWNSYNSDIQVTGVIDRESVTNIVEDGEKIDTYIYTSNCSGVQMKGEETRIVSMIGIGETEAYLNYNNYFDFYDNDLDELKEERNIILSEAIASKINKKTGDKLILKNSQDEEFIYYILGLMNAKMENMGMVAVIDEKNMKNDFSMDYSETLYIKIDGEETKINGEYIRLKDKLSSYAAKVVKESDLRNKTLEDNQSMIGILKQVSIFNLVIGCFGIINNIMISFLQRRKELAVLQTIGMSSGKKFQMLVWEALYCAVICMAAGLGTTVLAANNLEAVFKIMGTSIDLAVDKATIIEYVAITGILIVISSIIVIIKDHKNDILSVIRFE